MAVPDQETKTFQECLKFSTHFLMIIHRELFLGKHQDIHPAHEAGKRSAQDLSKHPLSPVSPYHFTPSPWHNDPEPAVG